MTDVLFDCPSSSKSAVESALAGYANVIGPLAGNLGAGGGDPNRLYYNVRPQPGQSGPSLPQGCTATDPALSASILGVWA